MSSEPSSRLGGKPATYDDVYEAISPARLKGSMEGKVVLVTGAGRGIGKAIALAFAEAGADVAILARSKAQLDEVANMIRSTFDRKALVCAVDATDSAAVKAAVEETERTLGPLDVVVPNAAAFIYRPFVYTPMEDWWRIIEINLRAPMMLAKQVLGSMQERNTGCILFISSRAGIMDLAGSLAYNVSKTALIRAAACLQLELDAKEKSGIHMYSLHPGRVKTKIVLDGVHPDIDLMKPGSSDGVKHRVANFKDTPELSAWTCVYLATGVAADVLRGRYVDVKSDVETIVRQADIVQKEGLYSLGIRSLGDAPL